MQLLQYLTKPVLYCAIITLVWTGFAFGAEQDDSTLFVEAFNAFQKKNYLLVLEKLDQLNRIFPDTPLRDVSLLLQARAAHKSGDNELAARSVNLFRSEFNDNVLKNTIEDDLIKLGNRKNAGEKLPADQKLRTAAQKTRSAQLELERAAALKAEQERTAREQAERDRIAKAKAEAERRERERIAAEMAAKASIKLEIVTPNSSTVCETGAVCRLPVQLINRGANNEEFELSITGAAEYTAMLSSAGAPDKKIGRLAIDAGKTYESVLVFKMPDDKVDGFRARLPIKAVSTKFSDISFTAQPQLTAAAPLIRVVARPNSPKFNRGDSVSYRIIILNAGSLAARGLKIKVIPPEQAEIADRASLAIDLLEPGTMKEFNINMKISERAQEKRELRCRVEVGNDRRAQKTFFHSAPVTVHTPSTN